MLELFTDINKVERIEVESDNVLESGVSGSWVTINSSSEATMTTSATGLAFQVWTESNRTGTIGAFTPDSGETGKVTLLSGIYRARTDQYDSTYAPDTIGQPLYVTSGGKLKKYTSETADEVVAYLLKTPYSYDYLGTTYTVIDILVK